MRKASALLEIRSAEESFAGLYKILCALRRRYIIHEFRRIISRSRETKTDNADIHVCVCVYYTLRVSMVSFSPEHIISMRV